MNAPGLIERRLIRQATISTVEIEEVWDVSVEGCPIIVVDLKSGHVNTEAVKVTRRVLMLESNWLYGQ